MESKINSRGEKNVTKKPFKLESQERAKLPALGLRQKKGKLEERYAGQTSRSTKDWLSLLGFTLSLSN